MEIKNKTVENKISPSSITAISLRCSSVKFVVMLELWELRHLLWWWGWLAWKRQTLSRNPKRVFHQVVLISQHILPRRILWVSVSKSPHCAGSYIAPLRGILLISPAGSTWDGSAKMEGENHTGVWAMLKSTPLNSLSCWEVSHPHFPMTSGLWLLASSTVLSALLYLSVSMSMSISNTATSLNTVAQMHLTLSRTGTRQEKC